MGKPQIEAIYPLAPLQEGMLFHSLYAPRSGVYIEQLKFTIQGHLHLSHFQQAWEHVIARHAVLRTLFRWERRDKPLQVVLNRVKLPWHMVDLRPHPDPAGYVTDFLHTDRTQGFDLAKPPLLRLTLFQTGDTLYQLVWTFHHLLMDGWSMALVFEEVFLVYDSLCRGESITAGPAAPYQQYIQWLQQQDLTAAESYWRQTLAGIAEPTTLPISKTSTHLPADEQRYTEQIRTLSPELTASLQQLARQQQVTLNTVVQGAWALLLSRYAGDPDVLFGTTLSSRPADIPGVERMVGLFINTLPIRVMVSPYMRLDAWLQQLQQSQAAARQFDTTPLAQIHTWMNIPAGRTLFENLLIFENYPISEGAWEHIGSDLTVSDVHFYEKTNYALNMIVVPGPPLVLEISYNTAHYEAGVITRLLDHMETILAGMATQPDTILAEVPMLTVAEREQLLHTWNADTVDYPQDMGIHELVAAQVAQTPHAAALIFGKTTLTYTDLDQQANQLAHYLQSLGVGPETLVGMYAHRSIEMVVGLLAILKAGGAYIPLDPAYPLERIIFMLEDAQAPVILTQSSLLAQLPSGQAQVVCLDAPPPSLVSQPTTPPDSRVSPDNLAYVIYTSGSTGRPKGVQIPHAALVNFLTSMQQQPGLAAGESLLAVTTLSFDIAALELYLPLLVGGCILLTSAEVAADGTQLQQVLNQHPITVMQATPATWRMLIAVGWTGSPNLKVLCGGEAMLGPLAQDLLKRCASVWNMYGPTETTIWSAVQPVTATDATRPVVSIGCPIANTQLYILDHYQQMVPVGVPGELFIGGDGLARGYLNRPALTAERFIPNPFGPPGSRLYRTGDLARYNPDGTLEFMGRIDHQVKIRGFRIELGEIEAVLRQHPRIREGVVVARDSEQPDGNKRLVAYLVYHGQQTLSPTELRQHLRATLPDYMVPAHFVALPALPLTPNGKIDRKALPAPGTSRSDLESTYTAPRTTVEKTLVKLWTDLLDIDLIGIHDNFFALGGDSLQAVRFVALASKALDRDISLPVIFENPTIASLIEAIGQARPATSDPLQADDSPPLESKPGLLVERRPLLTLFATGHLPPVEAAALYYIEQRDWSLSDDIGTRFDYVPTLTDIIETPFGRVALILLPHLDTDLYTHPQQIIQSSVEAVGLAQHIGAKVVSLTGMIPSATNLGQDIAAVTADHLPPVTTGHATTTATVVLSIEKLLRLSHRNLAHETVAILGLGSVGTATVRLMLNVLPHPTELILCDVFEKQTHLDTIRTEIIAAGYQGSVRIATARADAPTEAYAASLIVGATNVPNVLDVNRLKPGTLLVDDSSPHCFNVEEAIRRLETQNDILFTEGGVLKLPQAATMVTYVPKWLEQVFFRALSGYNTNNITGCILSSLLSARHPELEPTTWPVNGETSFTHYQQLASFEIEAADLHCDTYTIPTVSIEKFNEKKLRIMT